MIGLSLFTRTFGNPGQGPPGGETGCAVQGGPGCQSWGNGALWGDGAVWCSNVGVPYEFVAEKEVHAHRIAVKIKFTYCYTPGLPEAFRIFQVRGRWAPDRQAQFPFHAFIDGVHNSERLSAKIKYTAVPGIADQSDYQSHGTIVGTPVFHAPSAIQSGWGMGFGLETGPAYCTVPYRPEYSTAPLSVEFWALLDDTATNEWNTPITQASSDQWDDGWGFYDRHTTGEFTWWVNQYDAVAGPNQVYVRIPRPAANVYHHYVGTWDGATANLYVDGVLVGTTTRTVSPNVSTAPPTIGYGNQAQTGWQGLIDEVAIYDQVLTDYQVMRHFETGRTEYRAAVLQDMPLGHWTLDEEGPYGNEFKIDRIQLIASRKKHQPKG